LVQGRATKAMYEYIPDIKKDGPYYNVPFEKLVWNLLYDPHEL